MRLAATPSRVGWLVAAALLLLPATALASGGGSGMGVMLALFVSPVTWVILLVQGLVLRQVASPSARHWTGVGTLVVTALVVAFQAFFLWADVSLHGKDAFQTVTPLVLTIGAVLLTALCIVLGVLLVR